MSLSVLLEQITTNLNKISQELEFPETAFSVTPSKPGFGDISCNVAFLLAKSLKKKPIEISQQFVEKYQKYLGEFISKVEAHPSGYLNFFTNTPKLNELILTNSIKDDYGFIDVGNKSLIVVEHTSVNPNKALHIGHVRNIIIGDTLGRILEKANFDVKILNYVDDSGLQVADIIVGFKELGFPETPSQNQKFSLGGSVEGHDPAGNATGAGCGHRVDRVQSHPRLAVRAPAAGADRQHAVHRRGVEPLQKSGGKTQR